MKDGRWLLLKGGKIDFSWDGDTQPPMVVAQWTTSSWDGTKGKWQFAWYDGGYYGEYEEPTHWAEI
jgi:hypothetical protein